jgi:hypothetical protein
MANDKCANVNKRPSIGGGSPADGLSHEENFIAEPRSESAIDCPSSSVDDCEEAQGLLSKPSLSSIGKQRDVIPSPMVSAVKLLRPVVSG